ncbi:MAG: undecaprenyl/decaprenyl-phosphate alpha-N-acetylglucosaminyl 1-phosphate transferase [bacterium]|nr:MAG: undecaprenyl/decaprenyl-phosphate alpha-N-acetylglucosaminyl 1-phosphate transferase [bacterium]
MTIVGLIVAPVLSFVLGYFFTPLVRGIAVRWKLCEKPNGRTTRDIAHIGGVAIIGALLFTLIPVFLFYLPGNPLHRAFLPIFIASGFLTFLLGIIDDLRSLHYLYKLFFQIVVSVFVSAGGVALLLHFGIVRFSLPVALITFAITTVWVLVITTSFNLIDGIDGLAAGLALISAASFAIAGYYFDVPIVVALSLVVFGSVLAFLRYNFPPAKIFMGDSGSLFLGLMFGLISLLLIVPGQELFFRIAGALVILAIPILDTSLAFLRRLLTGRPVFHADLMHIHHILLYRMKSVRKVTLFLWSISAGFGILGILTMRGYLEALLCAVAAGCVVFVLALRRMVHGKLPQEAIKDILTRCGISTSRMLHWED